MGPSPQKRYITITRVAVDICLLLAVFFAHWTAVLAIGVIGAFAFRRYGELIAAGILLDVLYGFSAASLPFQGDGALMFSFLPYPIYYTVITLLLYVVGEYLKQFIRFYDT